MCTKIFSKLTVKIFPMKLRACRAECHWIGVKGEANVLLSPGVKTPSLLHNTTPTVNFGRISTVNVFSKTRYLDVNTHFCLFSTSYYSMDI